MKKFFKVILKIILIIFIAIVLLIGAYLFKLDILPEIQSKKNIDSIDAYAQSISSIDINDDVKLIGLGEATHGNVEFQQLKLDVLKTLVEKENIKGFAMEIDYGEGVIIDNYIKGSSDLTIDEIMSHISFDIYRTEDIKNIIEWMKDYNSNHNNELSFYGFDLQNPDQDLYVVTDFIKTNNIEPLYQYCESIDAYINGEFTFKDEAMIKTFEDIKYIQEELINVEEYKELSGYQQVLNCIDNVFYAKELAATSSSDSTLVSYGEYRDSKMCERILGILSNDEKLMITAHNGHVGYAGSYVKTMGAYLKEALNDEYFVIGTDYYNTLDNINSGGTRNNYKFCSADILAYQAKNLGTYYLDFASVDSNSNVYQYINEAINTGSIGESYSILNHILASTVRLHCEINYLYDAMIFVYEATPIEVISK